MSAPVVSRPLLYQPRGGSVFLLRGSLARPAAEELVGGLEEAQRVFTARWAEMVAGGVTDPEKYDGVTDPGPAAHLDTVAAEVSADEVTLCGLDAAGSLPFAVGAQWTAYSTTTTDWQTGTVLAIDAGSSGSFELSSSNAGLANQSIIIYPANVREYSVHNVAVLYKGGAPAWVRAEVTG